MISGFFVGMSLPACTAQTLASQTTSPLDLFAQSTQFSQLPEIKDSERITLERAVEIAFQENAQIKASRYQIEAAKANLSGQRAPINPTLTYGGLNNTVAPAPTLDVNNPSNYGVLFTVETNGAISWRTSQAHNQFDQATADAKTAFLNVRQSVTNAYIGLQIANRALLDEQEALKDAARIRDLTRQQFKLGAAPQTNSIRADIAYTQEFANMLNQVNAVKAARSALNIALGRKPEQPVDAAEPLEFAPIHEKLDDLQKLADANRPELSSATYSLHALKAAVGLQRSQYYPDLVVGTDFREVHSGVFQVGLTLPLFDFGSIRGAVSQAKKNVKAQESQIVLAQQQVRLDVESAYEALIVSEGTVEALMAGSLSQAEGLEQRIEKGYLLGGNTILDLLDAQSTLRASRIAYYGSIGNYRQALAQLERAIGAPVRALNTAPAVSPQEIGTKSR